jgi:2-polyprenyl-3-methyl-5-hydroxy-6-metoxy-1,4-benzoquinol methylase
MVTSIERHWESVYQQNDDELVGWFQAYPALSLRMVQDCTVSADAPIVDVGGGSSRLVDHLLQAGYTDVSVLDLSPTALHLAQKRLGARSQHVAWIEADVTEHRFARKYRIWHDRAVMHFLVDPQDEVRYVERLRHAIPTGGHAIIATFAPDGPQRCSGLPVKRHSAQSMSQVLGAGFEPVRFEYERHRTPSGSEQSFIYGWFRRARDS